MKHMKRQLKKLAVVMLAGAMLVTSASAQNNYLITIDVSDIANVTFTATDNFASVDSSTTDSGDGVELLGFLNTGNDGVYVDLSSTLSGGGSGISYDTTYTDNISTSGGDNLDLNLYSDNDSVTQLFNVSSPAFTGMATGDFTDYADLLPVAGATGDIRPGYNASIGPVIGQWQVIGAAPVPEPGTLALAALGGAGALLWARWRK
jgi:hypothetical protein